MKIVGLTGGIGSGKTTVANFFKELGVPIYIADAEAKKLMTKNVELQQKECQSMSEKTQNQSIIGHRRLSKWRIEQEIYCRTGFQKSRKIACAKQFGSSCGRGRF